MTSRFSDPPELMTHVDDDLLVGYATGSIDEITAWSIEAHLSGCAHCRVALSGYVDAGRLARNRSVLLVRAAVGDGGWACRRLRRRGVADQLLCLMAATPSLRRSWLAAVLAVLTAVTGESVLLDHLWTGPFGHDGSGLLAPFLLVAPLLVLAGVAAAFIPLFDPAHRLAMAAPFDAFTLLLIRVVSALITALVPVVVAAFIVPGPSWLPAALVLPSLALCGLALVMVSVIGTQAAAISSASVWVLSVLLVGVARSPLVIVDWHGQAACAVVLLAAAVVLLLRRDRFDFGWAR